MLRYTDYDIVFREIPDETTLAVNLAGCPNRCPGCHSPQLQEPIGEPLTEEVVERLLARYGAAVTCFCLMGGDAEPHEAARLALFARRLPARPAHGVVLRTCGVARRVRSDGSFRLRETRPLHRCAGAARRSGDQPAAMAHPARRPARRSHAAVLAQTRLKNRSGRAMLSPITSDPVSAADRPSSNGRRCCDRLRTDAPRAAEQRTNRRENRAIRKKCLPLRPVLQDSTPEGFVSGVR